MTTRRKLAVRYRAGLLLTGIGACLAFTVSFHTADFDPRTAGYLLIMTGVLVMAVPRRGAPGLRRSPLMHHYQQQVTPPGEHPAGHDGG